MLEIITSVSKYAILLTAALYTFLGFYVFSKKTEEERSGLYAKQIVLLFLFHLISYAVMFCREQSLVILIFYAAQVALLAGTLIAYRAFYPRCSRLLVNNMCFLLSIGFVILYRLESERCIKQFIIAAAGIVLSFVVPVIIRKWTFLKKLTWVYLSVGLGLLIIVTVLGATTFGSKISFTVGGVTLAPNEFIKILFVFFVAGMLSAEDLQFPRIALATVLAAAHVLVLVVARDLGSALIYFVVYMAMLFVATRKAGYVAAGLGFFSAAAVAAYYLFSHVRVRVQTWTTPFDTLKNDTSQLSQSLFAITTGGWFGMGLFEGAPNTIPVAMKDFVFSAICEEMGVLFALCLVLVCLSCFLMFINISLKLTDPFYRLASVGLSVTYIFQVFLTIGGDIKFIPLTGVPLPLVSYGGSSVLSSLIMFAIIQGLYILKQDE